MRQIASKHLSAMSSIQEVFPTQNAVIQGLNAEFDALAAVRHAQAANDFVPVGHGIVHFRARRATMMETIQNGLSNTATALRKFNPFTQKTDLSSEMKELGSLLKSVEAPKQEEPKSKMASVLASNKRPTRQRPTSLGR